MSVYGIATTANTVQEWVFRVESFQFFRPRLLRYPLRPDVQYTRTLPAPTCCYELLVRLGREQHRKGRLKRLDIIVGFSIEDGRGNKIVIRDWETLTVLEMGLIQVWAKNEGIDAEGYTLSFVVKSPAGIHERK